MKRLTFAKSVFLTVFCFSVINLSVSAKTMYRWTDEKGKVHFSDQVPPDQVKHGHEELDKNGQVIKAAGKAKTKTELEMEKRLAALRKQQEQILAKQKALDKKLLSGFLTVAAMDAQYQAKVQAMAGQEREMQESIKKLEQDLAEQQKKAASFEVKNQKIDPEVRNKMEEYQKNIAKTKQDIKDLQQKKIMLEKEFARDRARYIALTQNESNSKSSGASANNTTPDSASSQPGLIECDSSIECDKAWASAKEFVKKNTPAKISLDTDTLFMSEEPKSDSDLSLSVSKIVTEGKKTELFLDIRCTPTATNKGLCTGTRANELRSQFNDYINLRKKATTSSTASPATNAK